MRFLDVLTLMFSLYTVSDSIILSCVLMFLVTPFIYFDELVRKSLQISRIKTQKHLENIEKEILKKLKEEHKNIPKKEEETIQPEESKN